MSRSYLLRILLTCGLCGIVGVPRAAAENWPEFRGPNEDGHARATNLPVTWSEHESIRWKTAIDGKAWSSPVVWEGKIWLTNATPDGTKMSVLAVDLKTGKVLHDLKLWDVAEPQFCNPFNSYASSTPVIEEGRLYAHFGAHGTAAIDTNSGKILWKRLDFQCDHYRGAGSSPILFEDLLILTFDGADVQYLVALNKNTGETVWKTDRNIHDDTLDEDYKKAYSTPRVINVGSELQLISPSAGATISYDPRTGKELWRVTSGGMNAAARPLYAHGLVYATSAAGGWQLFAVKPEGRGDISQTNVACKYSKAVPTRSSPLMVGDRIYMVNDTGVMSCVDATTGKGVWTERVGGNFSSSPVYADGKMYFFDQEGAAHVVKPGDKYEPLATNELDEGMMASPVVVDNALIVRTRTHLYRIEQPRKK